MNNKNINIDELQGETLDVITFSQLIEQICGASFEEIYPHFLSKEKINEKSNLE